jgi:hypothetical protein
VELSTSFRVSANGQTHVIFESACTAHHLCSTGGKRRITVSLVTPSVTSVGGNLGGLKLAHASLYAFPILGTLSMTVGLGFLQGFIGQTHGYHVGRAVVPFELTVNLRAWLSNFREDAERKHYTWGCRSTDLCSPTCPEPCTPRAQMNWLQCCNSVPRLKTVHVHRLRGM